MNKKAILVVFALVVLAAAGHWFFKESTRGEQGFCSENGVVWDTVPPQSHRSYCVSPDTASATLDPGVPALFSFFIVDDRGAVLKDFAVTHTKPMHVLLVRKDLANFQHLHPEYDASSGRFTLPELVFPEAGEYRVFADFAPAVDGADTHGVTVYTDVTVGGASAYTPKDIGVERLVSIADGVRVVLSSTPRVLMTNRESTLTFTLTKNGAPVTDLEPYLGAWGHSVILREETLDFLHVHPVDDEGAVRSGSVPFKAEFPHPGKYKIFVQFQREGKVFLADFSISVAEGEGHVMPAGEEHSAH